MVTLARGLAWCARYCRCGVGCSWCGKYVAALEWLVRKSDWLGVMGTVHGAIYVLQGI